MGKEAATRTYIRLAAASVVGGAAVAYGLWSYWKDLRSPVELCYSPSTNNEEIVKGCPLLQGTYWPSPWMFSAHLQVGDLLLGTLSLTLCSRVLL